VTRNWRFFAQSLGFSLLQEVITPLKDADLETIHLPPWAEHPDLRELNPSYWRKQASVLLKAGNSALEQLLHSAPLIKEAHSGHDAEQAVLACLLHAAFSASRQEMASVFEKFELPLDSDGFPPASPFLTLSTLMRFYDTELEAVGRSFALKQLVLFRYYLYAINVQLKPQYAFLAANERCQANPVSLEKGAVSP
jgi:hypothetical protein